MNTVSIEATKRSDFGKSSTKKLRQTGKVPCVHVDFQELNDDRKITVEVPIVFEGLSEGVKEGGKLMPKLRKLRVKAFPKDLIDEIKVDVTELLLGKSINVGEISLENIEIMNNSGIPVCSVEIPRALKSADAAAEAEGAEGAAEGAEGAAEGGDDAAK